MIRNIVIAILFVVMTSSAWADNHTLEDQIPDRVLVNKDKLISLVVENDLFGRGTDQNYTSGVRLSYMDVNKRFPAYAERLEQYIPTFEINKTSSVFYSLGHNLYTPDDITMVAQDPNDRPWAAYLYGSMGMVTITDNHIDEVEASIGVIGPMAMGEQIQKFIHENISDSPKPMGWDNQLKNEPAIMLAWQRRWPEYGAQDLTNNLRVGASPHVGLTVGNVYTHASAGFNVWLNPKTERWQDLPSRVRPAIPGTGFFEIPSTDGRWWSWSLFGGVEGRAIARNIFLDGNTFRSSHDVNKKNFVADFNVGAAITVDQYRFSYTLNYRTREFDGQDSGDAFGALSFNYRF